MMKNLIDKIKKTLSILELFLLWFILSGVKHGADDSNLSVSDLVTTNIWQSMPPLPTWVLPFSITVLILFFGSIVILFLLRNNEGGINKFIFQVYSFIFSLFFFILLIILIAGTYILVNEFQFPLGIQLAVVASALGIGLVVILLLGDFVTKITIANQLIALNKLTELNLSNVDQYHNAEKNRFEVFESKLNEINKRLISPIKVHAVKPKPQPTE